MIIEDEGVYIPVIYKECRVDLDVDNPTIRPLSGPCMECCCYNAGTCYKSRYAHLQEHVEGQQMKWFTSDLHFAHPFVAALRGYALPGYAKDASIKQQAEREHKPLKNCVD